MNRLSLRTVIVTMMLVDRSWPARCFYNAVYGMLTDQTFSEMDLQLDRAELRPCQDAPGPYPAGRTDAPERRGNADSRCFVFRPGFLRRSIMQRLNMKTPSAPVILYDASGTPLLHRRAQRRDLLRSTAVILPTIDSFRAGNAGNLLLPRTAGDCFRDNYEFVAVMAQPVEYTRCGNCPQGCYRQHPAGRAASVCIEQSGEGRGQLILLTAAGEPLYSRAPSSIV